MDDIKGILTYKEKPFFHYKGMKTKKSSNKNPPTNPAMAIKKKQKRETSWREREKKLTGAGAVAVAITLDLIWPSWSHRRWASAGLSIVICDLWFVIWESALSFGETVSLQMVFVKRPVQFSGPVLVEFNRVVRLVLYNLYYHIFVPLITLSSLYFLLNQMQ